MSLSACDPSRNPSVAASAGTGKTWLLVSRLIRLLIAGAEADGILAITFTRKAAAEIQQRLQERLYELAAAADTALPKLLTGIGLPPDADTQHRARGLFEALLRHERGLRTTTFHAFCQELLRRFPLEAGVAPGFELLESGNDLAIEAWQALVAETTLQPDSELAGALQGLFLKAGSLETTRTTLNSFLDHRVDWWAYVGEEPDAAVGAAQFRLEELLLPDPTVDPAAELLDAGQSPALGEFRELLLANTASDRKSALRLAEALAAENGDARQRITALAGVFLTKEGAPRARKASAAQAKRLGATGQDRLLELHALFSIRCQSALDHFARRDALELNLAWYRCGQRLLDHYQRIKAERRLLDFSDLEWRAYRLLHEGQNASWVQYKLDASIRHLLVDEFQDTNPTQWHLLLPLLQEMAAGDRDGRSVFLVGDEKQSIYGFRRADPALFQQAAEFSRTRLDGASVALHKSRRSSPAIMHLVNRVFADQDLPGFEPHDTYREADWGRVTLLPLSARPQAEEPAPGGPLRNPLLTPRPSIRETGHLREGRLLGAHIQALIAAGTPLRVAEVVRPVGYQDILILARTRTHLEEIEAGLREYDVPYVGASRGTLMDCLEVRDLEALLRTLAAPFDNLALAQVLRSPLFDCGDGDLIALARGGQAGWWQRLQGTREQDSAMLQRAAALLLAWHRQAEQLPVHDLLTRVYHEGQVLERYRQAAPSHLRPRVEANLERLVELALEVDSGRYPSLGYFLARIGQYRERDRDGPDEPPSRQQLQRVRIMTIHAAKGLEAPIVFLADAVHQSRDRDAWHALVHWPTEDERPGILLLPGPGKQRAGPIQAYYQQHLDRQQRESLNLLYVALTRARQYLYVSGVAPGKGSELGWYGLIASAYAADGDACLELEQHLSEPENVLQIPAPPEHDTQLPPEWSRPLKPAADNSPQTPSDALKGTADLERGNAIHRLLDLMSGVSPLGRDEALQRLTTELRSPGNDEALAAWADEAEEVLNDPGLAALFRPDRYQRAWNELPISFQRGGRSVNGVIDRLLLSADGLWLLDYKTHAQATSDNIQQLAEGYRAQLGAYAEGLARIWPDRPIRRSLLFTACRTLVDLD